jgi:hypothetical protein
MPAYDALEPPYYHFYLGCWKFFFGNTVYRLLFSLGHPLFFPSITLVILVFSFFHRKQMFPRIVPDPQFYHFFCFHHHGVGSFYLWIFNNSKWSSEEGNECMGLFLERDEAFSRSTKGTKVKV